MASIEPLSNLFGINPKKFSKEENILIEAELFSRICEELMKIFREQNKDYFFFMKFDKDKENKMLEMKYIPFIIEDILSSKEYTLAGIAIYANAHEDIIYETYAGLNLEPSATLLRRIIELHRTVRRELYQKIMKKIALEYLSAA